MQLSKVIKINFADDLYCLGIAKSISEADVKGVSNKCQCVELKEVKYYNEYNALIHTEQEAKHLVLPDAYEYISSGESIY